MEGEGKRSIVQEAGAIERDALRFGLHGVKSDLVGTHPLESSYPSAKRTEEEMKRRILANTYGTAFPLKINLDQQILSWNKFQDHNFQRPPGPIPSSMLGLEALTGSLDNFGFEDYLNDPRESESFRALDMHHVMEVLLGISKGPCYSSFM